MRTNPKLLVLNVTLAAAMSALIAGCGQGDQPAPPAKASIGTQIDDTTVTAKVKSALLADPDIKSFDLKVETRKGTVQLSGFVDNQGQIDRALAAARGVEGVVSVDNGISLKSGSTTVGNAVDDGIITTQVKSALLADPNVKSFDIAVVTRKGEVQLSGFVNSQSQIDQAVAIASKVSGVTGVVNQMSVKK